MLRLCRAWRSTRRVTGLVTGKGFYDEMLKHFRGLKIALAFDCQMQPVVPHTETTHGWMPSSLRAQFTGGNVDEAAFT